MIQHKRNVNRNARSFYFSWKWFFISLSVICLFLIIFKIFFLSKTARIRRQLTQQEQIIIQREKINQQVKSIVLKYGIKEDWIKQKAEETIIKIPGSVPTIQLCQEIAAESEKLGAEVWKSHEDLKTETIILELGHKGVLLQNFKFVKNHKLEPARGKIALIIDDFGYHLSNTVDEFLNLKIPLTISIIPGLEYSIRIAEQAVLYKKEILIHLPMEPLEEKIEDHGFTILTSLSDIEIHERIKKACEILPAAVGLNNHQGSKAMADQRVVTLLMEELKQQHLFFIDSRTKGNSVGQQTARQNKIPTASRDIFLDNEDDAKAINAQFLKLATQARKNGIAIGIGHVKPITLQILTEKISEFQLLGFQFVYISEIVR